MIVRAGARSEHRSVVGVVPVIVIVAGLVAGALAGCGSQETGADADLDAAVWVAAGLTVLPEGYSIGGAAESSTWGRTISYRKPAGTDAAYRAQIAVRTRVPMLSSVEDMLATEVDPLGAGAGAGAGVEGARAGEVGGRPALVRPVPDGLDGLGWEVVWEPSPALQVSVTDGRRALPDGMDASPESALALAAAVGGLDRSDWADVLRVRVGLGSGSAPPPSAVEREVAEGVLDGRRWTLSVLGPPDAAAGWGSCFRLSYAGGDTGRGCSPERVVLGGKGFVLGWFGGGGDPGELVPWAGSSFDPIQPTVHAFGPAEHEGHVSLAVLPDGTCGVVRIPRPGMVPTPLDLLPGDPGALECVTP